MAIDARKRALEEFEGDYWASATGGHQRHDILAT